MKNSSIGQLVESDFWGNNTATAGRVVSYSKLGNICFLKIQDSTGVLQLSLKKQTLEENYKAICNSFTRGMHIAVVGNRWTTLTGEVTLDITSLEVVQSACASLPDKWHGMENAELRLRKRYMETSTNLEAAQVFIKRSKIIQSVRNFLIEEDYLEVDTPVLTHAASGAMASPFVTHSNALDKDFYLRIAPETNLKVMVGGGFDRVFEIGKNYRNEGMSRQHLNEYLAIEYYAAYETYQTNKIFFLRLIDQVLEDAGFDDRIVPYGEHTLDFNTIQTVLYRDLFINAGFQSPDTMSAAEADEVFKKSIRPTLIQPVIVEDYPAHLSPMAKRRDDDSTTAEQWQFIVAAMEITKAYSELVDPVLQRELLEEQMNQKNSGNEETMMIDEPYLEAMSAGFPPIAGTGIGLERLIMLLTNSKSIRDVVFFPMMG